MKNKPGFVTWGIGDKLFNSNRQIYEITNIAPKKVTIMNKHVNID